MFSTDKDFYARMFVYAYFIPEKNILFIINCDETRWGTIRSDGSGVLDNILDYDNERYSASFDEGTFTTVFNIAKKDYEECIHLWKFIECPGIYPFSNEKLCTLGHEITYLLLKEIKNNMEEEYQEDW
jgi:hypothetical protein